jgi:hypothetical protein
MSILFHLCLLFRFFCVQISLFLFSHERIGVFSLLIHTNVFFLLLGLVIATPILDQRAWQNRSGGAHYPHGY